MLSTLLVFAWILLPAACWLLNLFTGRRIHGFILFLLAGISGYVLLLGTVAVANAELDAEIKQYDVDGDGGYSPDELTPEAKEALDRWASDTGRQLAPIIGIPFTVIWYGLVLAILYFGEWLTRMLFFRSKPAQEPVPPKAVEPEKIPPPAEDGNPYRPPRN